MYYNRVLYPTEELYVSRAQQKVAQLTAELAEEYSRNDVDEYKAQLVVELNYSIEVLMFTNLAWTSDDIGIMIDYYTVLACLTSFGKVDFDFVTIKKSCCSSNIVYATRDDLLRVEQESKDRDTIISDGLAQEILDRIQGDQDLHIRIDAISAGGSTTVEITSQVNLGSIYIGEVFPIGTPLQDIIIRSLEEPQVSNLSFDSFVEVLEASGILDIAQFTWDLAGTEPIDMKLSDSRGVMVNVPVSGSSYTPNVPVSYDLSVHGKITWTLSADNMEDITVEVGVWYPTYIGYMYAPGTDAPIPVTPAMALAGTKSVVDTAKAFTFKPVTGALDQAFITVHATQSIKPYEYWEVSGANQSKIGSEDFIIQSPNIYINGEEYNVFQWGYRSPISDTLTLSFLED